MNVAFPNCLESEFSTFAFSPQAHDLGDQDAINTIAITMPEVIYILPCAWNYQTAHWWHVQKVCGSVNQLSFFPCFFSKVN